ncbi:MAG: hypothetical protein NW215_04025 [Hyphomicrobiales bacterium]|nr:hypothetical protein [Hyphomicrobiales bacterium]
MMIKVIFWVAALLLGAGIGYAVKAADTVYIMPEPSSLPFMVLILLAVTALFQVRFNLENRPPSHARFVIGPPDISIFGEIIAAFVGNYLVNLG